MIPINLTGKKFGRLTVLSYDSSSRGTGHAWWLCKCKCGRMLFVKSSRLKSGTTRSCGCLAKESARKLLTKYAKSEKHKGQGNPSWKGDDAKHAAIHTWLNRHFKKKKCEECGTEKNLEFALKAGERHGHDRQRYKVLCRSHHMVYDYQNKMR